MMTQVNNNAESLSRELRKFKNIKSVDFRGLLSGNSESFVNLYRHLFCENNVVFSRFIVEKGYDLSSLNDYKFMEAVYKMMRDLFNLKPPINQNQFFTQGFTQRKLEMSTMLATHIRKLTNDLNSRGNKMTVQTQSLMKSSLKRPNSAPKPMRVIELGDEEDEHGKSRGYSAVNTKSRLKKTKIANKPLEKNVTGKCKPHMEYKDQDDEDNTNNLSSDSERSNPVNSYNYKLNTAPMKNNHIDNHHSVLPNAHKYPAIPQFRDHHETGSVSAYESSPLDHDSYVRPERYGTYSRLDNHDHRAYDVKQYTPRTDDDTLQQRSNHEIVGLDKITQQFETVLARITLLESRVQRIESKFKNNGRQLPDYQPAAHSLYSSQNNQNYPQFTAQHHYHDANKYTTSTDKNVHANRDSINIIPDFESNYQGHTHKIDFDKPHTTYGTNSVDTIKHNSERSYPSYGANATVSLKNDFEYRPYHTYTKNTSGSFRSNVSADLNHSNASKNVNCLSNYSDRRSLDMNNSSRESSYRGINGATSTKSSQQILKIPNGIPPTHPTMKKSDDSGFDENRLGKSHVEKGDSYIQSQTDRIASLLSDTQKMLRISDEEL